MIHMPQIEWNEANLMQVIIQANHRTEISHDLLLIWRTNLVCFLLCTYHTEAAPTARNSVITPVSKFCNECMAICPFESMRRRLRMKTHCREFNVMKVLLVVVNILKSDNDMYICSQMGDVCKIFERSVADWLAYIWSCYVVELNYCRCAEFLLGIPIELSLGFGIVIKKGRDKRK